MAKIEKKELISQINFFLNKISNPEIYKELGSALILGYKLASEEQRAVYKEAVNDLYRNNSGWFGQPSFLEPLGRLQQAFNFVESLDASSVPKIFDRGLDIVTQRDFTKKTKERIAIEKMLTTDYGSDTYKTLLKEFTLNYKGANLEEQKEYEKALNVLLEKYLHDPSMSEKIKVFKDCKKEMFKHSKEDLVSSKKIPITRKPVALIKKISKKDGHGLL